jgi:RNA polymerase sigma-70 factor (ECF subfamily)
MTPPVHEAVLTCARDSYSQLLAFVASRAGGDLASAEDALGEAFLAALQRWPEEGIPERPDAWLLTIARRRLIDLQRRETTRVKATETLMHAMTLAQSAVDEGHDFQDDRLKLLFVCGHPAIDASARTPLMLQTVLGMNADRIASAFLVPPATMGQRLVRAKAKIHAARIPFQVPAAEEWPERLAFVLDAIYAAFNAGWETVGQEDAGHDDLAKEAIYLARAVIKLVPDEPEALGLLSLMLHVHARQHARFSESGRFIPLTRQDAQRWSPSLIAEAELLLRRASSFGRPGRFQIEAAIQSVHAQRATSGIINWPVIEGFYQVLRTFTTAIGARIGHAVAMAQVRGSPAALAELDALPEAQVLCHQPYWAARGHLLRQMGKREESNLAYQRAIGLTEHPALRAFLLDETRS